MSNKIVKKNKAYHESEHRKLYGKANGKIKKLPIRNRATKLALSRDLEHANGDLMHFLAMKENTFKTKEEYITTINAYLSLEVATYKFPKELKYEVGKMAQLMEEIKDFHNRMDRHEELKETIGL